MSDSPRFDDVTGLPSQEVIAEEQKASEESAARDATEIEAMASSTGWKLVEDMIVSTIDQNTRDLVLANNFQDIQRLQHTIRAYSSVLNIISHHVALSQHLRKQAAR